MKVILCVFGFTSIASASTLNIHVTNINNTKGQVLIALYNSPDNFPEAEAKYQGYKIKPISGRSVSQTVENLPPGRYAVVAFHDANDNGKLDKNWVGRPTEQYGFSNGVTRPDFEKSAFVLPKTGIKSITIKLNDA